MRKLLIGAAVAVLCSLPAPAPAVTRVPDGTIIAVAPLGCADANAVVVQINGYGSLGISVQGPFVGAVQFAATMDGVQFSRLFVKPMGGGPQVAAATAPGQWTVNGANLFQICLYASDLSSGSPVVTIDRSLAHPDPPASDIKPPGAPVSNADSAQVVTNRDPVRVQVVTQPLNPLLPRCNPIRTTQCQP